MAIRRASEAYLPGGRSSVTAVAELYESFVGSATADGGVARLAGEGAWTLEHHPGVGNLIDHESELTMLAGRQPQMILCLFDLTLFGGAVMVDLLETHPKIVVGGTLMQNPHYRRPEQSWTEWRSPST